MKTLISLFKKSFAYLVWLLLIGIIILMHYKGKRLESENDALGEDVKRSEKMTQIYLDRNNQLIPKIEGYENKVTILVKKLKDKDAENKTITQKFNEKVRLINKFNINDMQAYLDPKFTKEEKAKITDKKSVVIMDSLTAKQSIKKMEEATMYESKYKLAETVIKAKDSVITYKDSAITDLKEINTKCDTAVKQNLKTMLAQNIELTNKDKIIKKEKRKTNIWKIIALASTSFLGAVLIIK